MMCLKSELRPSCANAKTVTRALHYRRFLPKLKAAPLLAHLPDEKAKAEPYSFTMVCLCGSAVPKLLHPLLLPRGIVCPSLPCVMH